VTAREQQEAPLRILISAQIEIASEKREQTLRDARPFIEAALAEPGCVHYDWSIDVNRPTRINVFEEWESEAALQAHFDAEPYRAMRAHLRAAGTTSSVARKYRCDLKESVYDENLVPQAAFAGQRS
jgi:quinol monooxygenase YgiN